MYSLEVVIAQLRLRGYLVTDGGSELECMSRHGIMQYKNLLQPEVEGRMAKWPEELDKEKSERVEEMVAGWEERRRGLDNILITCS